VVLILVHVNDGFTVCVCVQVDVCFTDSTRLNHHISIERCVAVIFIVDIMVSAYACTWLDETWQHVCG